MRRMAGTHRHGSFTVVVGPRGEIQVRPGDSLSAYSQAIYRGDMRRIADFGRMEGTRVVPIPNPNMIRAGETVYHIPTWHATNPASSRLPPAFVQNEMEARKLFLASGPGHDAEDWEAFRTAVEDTTAGWGRVFLVLNTAEKVAALGRFHARFRTVLTPQHWGLVLKYLAGVQQPDVTVRTLKRLIAPTPALARGLETAKQAGDVVGYLSMLINSAVAWSRGDYHIVAVEAYKFAMGKAVAWAGLVNGIQEFVSGVWPETANDRRWRIIRACDLIGLGAVGVDTVGVMVTAMLKDEPSDQAVERLAMRIKKSPARVFYEVGEDLSDALISMSRMSDQEFSNMMSVQSVADWVRYLITDEVAGPDGTRVKLP